MRLIWHPLFHVERDREAVEQRYNGGMTDPHQRRFEDHALQRIASTSNPNEQERRLAVELLEARHSLTEIRDLAWNWQDQKDWKTCAARVCDIAQIATLPKRP